jgi:hypothetical protein
MQAYYPNNYLEENMDKNLRALNRRPVCFCQTDRPVSYTVLRLVLLLKTSDTLSRMVQTDVSEVTEVN